MSSILGELKVNLWDHIGIIDYNPYMIPKLNL